MSSEENYVRQLPPKVSRLEPLKEAKAPTMKDDLAPLIAELLALKVSFKEVTGTDLTRLKTTRRRRALLRRRVPRKVLN